MNRSAKKDERSFFQKASFLARLGSGSAARSVFGGYSVWGQHEDIGDSNDEIAIPLGIDVNQKFVDPSAHNRDRVIKMKQGENL